MHQPSEHDDWHEGHDPDCGQLPMCGQLPLCEYEDGHVGQVPPTEIPPGIGQVWQKFDAGPDWQDWQAPCVSRGPPALQPQVPLDETPGAAGL